MHFQPRLQSISTSSFSIFQLKKNKTIKYRRKRHQAWDLQKLDKAETGPVRFQILKHKTNMPKEDKDILENKKQEITKRILKRIKFNLLI